MPLPTAARKTQHHARSPQLRPAMDLRDICWAVLKALGDAANPRIRRSGPRRRSRSRVRTRACRTGPIGSSAEPFCGAGPRFAAALHCDCCDEAVMAIGPHPGSPERGRFERDADLR